MAKSEIDFPQIWKLENEIKELVGLSSEGLEGRLCSDLGVASLP